MAALNFFTPCSTNKTRNSLEGANKNFDISGNNKAKFNPVTRLNKSHIQALPTFAISSPTEILTSKQPDTGRLLKNGLLFSQNFTVRSFEIGSDSKMSMGALMNYLQETSLNHQKSLGLLGDGFGSCPKMISMDLVWIICWSHIEVDHFPSWADVVQVDTWKYRSGKNRVGCDWHVRDFKTGKTLIRATSLYAMMNTKTRKFAKLTEEILEEVKRCLHDIGGPMLQKDTRKLVELDIDKADHVRSGLMPGWTEMDLNQHVSHIKLINYVLESVPRLIVESHRLSAMTLEYRNECNGDSALQSLSSSHVMDNEGIEFDHMLRHESGQEIVRARTMWKKRFASNDGPNGVHAAAESACIWNY